MARIAPDFFPRRVNQFVPDMQYSADIAHGGMPTVKLEDLVAPDADYFRASAAVTSGQQALTLSGTGVVPHKYGVAATVTWTPGSGAGGERSIALQGFDYLGQPMSEVITPTSGTTVASGAKAFKEITEVTVGSGAAASGVAVGFGSRWGLPYRTTQMGIQSYQATEGGAEVISSGTLTPGHTTSNAASGPVSGTGDPRGTFVAAATTSGTASIPACQTIEAYVDRSNLHGYKQFKAVTSDLL